jgi:FkbM family methyltransferase
VSEERPGPVRGLFDRAVRSLGRRAGDDTGPGNPTRDERELRAHQAWLEARLRDLGLDDVSSPGPTAQLAGSDAATVADVFYCFRLLLGRLPSDTEWRGHSAAAGQPLRDVVRGYLQSLEFTNRRMLNPPTPTLELVQLDRFRLYIMPDDVVIGRGIATHRAYEPAVTRAVEAVLRPGMTFLDVGANIGYFSLLAASCVGPSGKVFAFEPSQTNVKLLHASRVLNGFENVEVFPLAAGREWELSFYDASHSNGWVSPIASKPEDLLPRAVVLTAPLATILPADRRIDMIKIDVEGAEYQALQGARAILERDHPPIVSEFSPPALESISGVSGAVYLEFLTALGYRLSVLADGDPIACGTDVELVMRHFADSGVDHIDLLAE